MPLTKNPYQILSEAYKSESFNADDTFEDNVISDFESEYGDVEELDDECGYTIEMVNLTQQTTSTGFRYLMEFETLAKYMESSNIEDVTEAMVNIAEHNSIATDDICVVIESDEYAHEFIEEAKKLKKLDPKKLKLKEVKSAAETLKMLKDKGIKVLKKKSKKKT